MQNPTLCFKTRLIATLINIPFILSLCACVGLISLSSPPQEQPYIIPPDNYRNITCQQYTAMMHYIALQVQSNHTAEQIYNSITPVDAPIRVQYIHAAIVDSFVQQNVPAIPKSQLAQLQNNCEQQNTLTILRHTINSSYCDVLQNIAHNSIANRDNHTSFPQTDIKAAIANFKHTTNSTPLSDLSQKIAIQHITKVIQDIYDTPDSTVHQVNTQINATCRMAP